MKPVLLTASIAAIVAVAACNGREEQSAAPESPSTNVAVAVEAITPANAYDIRHERFEAMGDSIKALNRELKGDAPDLARIKQEAAAFVKAAEQLMSWFPAGSGPDVHPRSRAKAEIWTDPAGFSRAHAGFQEQAQAFQRLAEAGEIEPVRSASQALGKSCGNCHDSYRGPEK